VHVRVAPAAQHRGLTPLRRILTIGLAATLAMSGAACRASGPSGDWGLSLEIEPLAPAVGRNVHVAIALTDGAERPWAGAALQVEAHMEHPGMAPVIASAVERGRGVYATDLKFTMAGSWIVYVTGRLPDGRRIRSRMGAPVIVSATGG
jgi:hypothetical protein